MSESFDKIYGGRGIDTPYEREKVEYRPQLKFKKEQLEFILRPETKQAIERSRTFTISHNLSEYDELIAEVGQMLKDIEARNKPDLMKTLNVYLSERKYKEQFILERQLSGYDQSGDYELYSLLYNMKESMQVRRDFIDNKFRTQITNETSIESIQESEEKSISEWEQLEARVLEGYKDIMNHDDEDEVHPLDDDTLTVNSTHLTYGEIEKLEKEKRTKEMFHTSLADTSYVHRNRYFMFLEIIEKAKILTYHSNSLVDKNLKSFILSLKDLGNMTTAKAHLILQFKKVKDKHESLKGRMMTLDDEKETFASEKQYMYQQLETKTTEPLKDWLYQQNDDVSGALDIFSSYLVDSMKDSRKNYEDSLSDMLNFYKSEADFYDQQINFLKNKEEIRKFYSILKDLEDVEQIQGEWVEEYLKANGYTV